MTDTGPGIPLHEQGKLFEKFEQLGRSSSERPRGTGLGLAISKELVALHKGEITVTSEVGTGTRFEFTLPIYHAERAFAELFAQDYQTKVDASGCNFLPWARGDF